jgi:quinoprotein glucose dehydrogenase
MRYIGAYGEGFPNGSLGGPFGLPLVKPPWGRITAIDLNTGKHVWMVPNSDTPDWARNNPALAGLTIARTGSFDQAGLLVTKTLLIAGEGSGLWRPGGGGNKLRAHDKATGAILHELTLPANQSGVPMSYEVDGRQYIVVAVGAKGVPGELVALSLP